MPNKPVAWMLTLPDGTHDWILDGNGCEGYIPLYTHPVKDLDEDFDAICLENKRLQAEIEALKEQLDKAIDAEKDRRFE